mgnify:CR=1 FL=1
MMTNEDEIHRCAPPWHMDCLGTVAILALGFDKRQRRRLSGRFDVTRKADTADPVIVYQDLHEACHASQPLVNAIARELDDRFGRTVRQVASAPIEEIRAMDPPLVLPLLWATLNDPREAVRFEGRRRLHALLLQAFRLMRTAGERREVDPSARFRAFYLENQALKARVAELEEQLKQTRERVETAGPHSGETSRHRVPEKAETSGIVGRLDREIRKLSHALEKERRRAARLEGELLSRKSREPAAFASDSHWGSGCRSNAVPLAGATTPEERWCSPPCPPRAVRANEKELEPGTLSQESKAYRSGQDIPARRATMVCKGDVLCPDRVQCTRDCPLKDLTVAILGGSEGALPAYRCMVGDLGGECLYHNGCLRKGAERLKRIIGQADIVVCITSVNSHAAMHFAKTICKRSGKRMLVTRESGVHALREMLQQTVH